MKRIIAVIGMVAAFLGTPRLEGSTGSGSHGGVGIVVGNQLYTLDLVEAGIERSADVDWGISAERLYVGNGRIGEQPLGIREITLVRGEERLRRYLIDTEYLYTLNALVAKSTPENDHFFGQHLPNICQTCYSEATALSVGLANKFNQSGGNVDPIIWRAFNFLEWILVRAPLRRLADENSSFADSEKYAVATRQGRTVRISEIGWSQSFMRQGQAISPLDLTNRAALITHELYYYVTSQQGDTDSDRARMINSELWTAYRFDHVRQTTFRLGLYEVAGRPSDRPRYVSELRPGTEIELKRDILVPSGASFMALVRGHLPMTDRPYHTNFYPYREGSVRLFNANNLFLQAVPLRAGTRMPIESVSVNVGNTDMVTRILINPRWHSEIRRIDVYTPRRGTPATMDDFNQMVSGTLEWLGPAK